MQEPGEAPLPVSTLPMFMGWHAHLLCVRICLRIRLNLSEVPEELERRAEPGFQSVLFREDPRTQANQREAKQQGHSYAGSVETHCKRLALFQDRAAGHHALRERRIPGIRI